MKSKKSVITSKDLLIFQQIGENIKLARKRRKLTTTQVAEKAGIVRSTLYRIEKGSSSISMESYYGVLKVFDLHKDFLKLAGDDEYGRKLQDLKLLASKKALKPPISSSKK